MGEEHRKWDGLVKVKRLYCMVCEEHFKCECVRVWCSENEEEGCKQK